MSIVSCSIILINSHINVQVAVLHKTYSQMIVSKNQNLLRVPTRGRTDHFNNVFLLWPWPMTLTFELD